MNAHDILREGLKHGKEKFQEISCEYDRDHDSCFSYLWNCSGKQSIRGRYSAAGFNVD
jgi:hypothetical protein